MNRTQKLFVDEQKKTKFQGRVDEYIKFAENYQLLDAEHWTRFVNQFRKDSDSFDAGWRGEYWGKMMRGAALTYRYTRNPKLYETMKTTIEDIISCQDEDGRISSYGKNTEFCAWDMWCRKYVMLGMQYFLDINEDKAFEKKIIDCIKKQANYIISKIGPEDGKKSFYDSTNHVWKGLNACSILEPFVRLFNLTKEDKYLEFAKYIISTGFTFNQNIIDLCIEGKTFPYEFKSTKAYEMISCFEGLLEFYYVTGIEKYKTAVINFAKKILESDFTVIGSCGCTHELFDHSTVRQANISDNVMQETCVTVTLMKFLLRVGILSGDSSLFDAFETSMYNAYFGALNINKNINPKIFENTKEAILEALPYDSYSPLTPSIRGQLIGGLKIMSDNHYYGCCACIASAGWGLIEEACLLKDTDGFVMNLFIPGEISTTFKDKKIKFITKTNYPVDGKINIKLQLNSDEQFTIKIRNPKWNHHTTLLVNNEPINVVDDYISINRKWSNNDQLEFTLDMTTEIVRPIYYGSQMLYTDIDWIEGNHKLVLDKQDEDAMRRASFRRGPLVLAVDDRLVGDATNVFPVKVNSDESVDAVLSKENSKFKSLLNVEVPLTNGNKICLVDYASAGQDWKSKIAAWFLIK